MSNSILDAMAVEYESGAHRSNAEAMRAALLWLASNVSDEMVQEANERFNRTLWADTEAGRKSLFKLLVETALRAAAG